MEKYELQKLRDLPIEGVAERLGLHVVRHKALCPFHDDHHASLSFRVSKNTFRCSDCWAMLSAGHKAIAIPSATLLSQKDIEQLSIINSQLSISYHMFPDRDEPGERLFLQLKEVLPTLQHHQLPPGCKDFSEKYLKDPLNPPV